MFRRFCESLCSFGQASIGLTQAHFLLSEIDIAFSIVRIDAPEPIEDCVAVLKENRAQSTLG
jgi:hypothetical protein